MENLDQEENDNNNELYDDQNNKYNNDEEQEQEPEQEQEQEGEQEENEENQKEEEFNKQKEDSSFNNETEERNANKTNQELNDNKEENNLENRGIKNDYNKEKIQEKKRNKKKIYDKNINLESKKNFICVKMYIIISIITLFFFQFSHMKILQRKLDVYINEISMIIYGSKNLKILYNITKNTPSELYINGNQFPINTNISSKENLYYNITMKWNYLLSDCSSMFYGLTEIREIDLSNFDFSNVENMSRMFYGAKSLIK